MITEKEQIELAKVIDFVINHHTQIHMTRDMYHMSQTGQPQPTLEEMPQYVTDSRQGVCEILAELN